MKSMRKRVVSFFVAIVCVIASVSFSSIAEMTSNISLTVEALELIDSGTCGDGVSWELDVNGILTISGNGAMTNSPWQNTYQDTIRSVVIQSGITNILEKSFKNCSNLSVVTIGNSVVYVGENAFQSCKKISSLVLPDSVTSIYDCAFMGCDNLTSITLSNKLSMIGSQAFYGCESLEEIIMPETVSAIHAYAFFGCSALKTITIPASVKYIGSANYVFCGCANLTKIIVDANNSEYTSVDGVLMNKARTSLLAYPEGKKDTTYTLPTTITSSNKIISQYLKEIDFNNITEVTSASCSACPNLTDIIFRNKDCEIYDSADTIPSSAVIHGYAGSSAETYADKYSRTFVKIDDALYSTTTTTTATVAQGGSIRFTLSDLNMKNGDTLHLNLNGDAEDVIQVHFYYTDSDGDAASSIVGGLGGTVLDSNGTKTVDFTAPNDLDSVTIKVVYNKSTPTYNYSVDYKTVTTTTTTKTTTTTTKTTTTTTKTTTTMASTTTTTTSTSSNDDNSIIIGADDYSFLNNSEYFNDTYNMSDYMKSLLNERANNMEWEFFAKFEGTKSWDGSCYGMSAVEILVKSGVLDVSSIDASAKKLYDLAAPKSDVNVESIINYYHLLQHTKVYKSKSDKFMHKTNRARIDELIEMVKEVENGGAPVLLCFNYTKTASGDRRNGGHAVVAYGIENSSWTYSGGTYDCRILISDPNVSGLKNENCLYINTETYKWEIPYYQEKYYSCTNNNEDNRDNPYAHIQFVTNDTNLIDTFGFLRNTQPATADDVSSRITIDSNSSNYGVSYYDKSSSGSLNDSTCELLFYSSLSGSDAVSNEIIAILPEADIAYEYFEKTCNDFNTSIEYTNSIIRADVTNGSYAIYQPDESIEISGNDSDYTLSLLMNEGYHPTDWYKIEVSGVNASNAELSVADGGYAVSNDSFSDGIMVKVSNRDVTASIGLVTDCESLFVYEIDETTIGIKLDTDNDGIYETDFQPDYIGDGNQNGSINLVDVVLLQKYLLNIVTIDRKQCIAMDMNMDGAVNVLDLMILKRTLLSS